MPFVFHFIGLVGCSHRSVLYLQRPSHCWY